MNDKTPDRRDAMEFPCTFPIKAMGTDHDALPQTVAEIVRRHAPETPDTAITSRASSGGRFLSVTVTVNATSREQLDAIYQDLTDSDQVMMAL